MLLVRVALIVVSCLLPACSCALSHAVDDASAPDAWAVDAAAMDGGMDADAAIVPGICGATLALIDPSHEGADGVYRATVMAGERLDEVSCPRDGPATEVAGRVVHLVASVPGDWTLRVRSESGTTSQLRRSCDDTTSAIDCRVLSAFSWDSFPFVWHVVAAGESIDWLLRSRAVDGTFDVEAWPPRGDGDSCAPVENDHSMLSVGCVAPLACQNWAPAPTCATNTVPTLDRVEIYRDGTASSGHVILWGSDATPNLTSLNGTSPTGVGFQFFVVSPQFAGASFVVDFYEPIPPQVGYQVTVADVGGRSNPVTAMVQPSGMNEPCALLHSCPSGLSCQDDGLGTMRCRP